jgi:hypothetical protein
LVIARNAHPKTADLPEQLGKYLFTRSRPQDTSFFCRQTLKRLRERSKCAMEMGDTLANGCSQAEKMVKLTQVDVTILQFNQSFVRDLWRGE